MIGWRLLFAIGILTPLLGLLWVDYHYSGPAPGIWLVPLGLLAVLLAAGELLDLLSEQPYRPAAWAVYAGVAMVYLSACAPLAWGLTGVAYPPDCPLGKLGWPLAGTALATLLVFAAALYDFQDAGGHIHRVALGVFVIVYVGLFGSFLAELRFFHDNQWGTAALVSVLFVVKLSDTGAYAAGKLVGRHAMAPRLSPHKTIEGALGGFVAGAVASVVYFGWLVPQLVDGAPAVPLWRSVLFGLIVAAAGMMGDLCESLLKRDAGRKHSSGWLRGLGGMLDVMDSVIVAAPVAFLCWVGGLVGP